MSLHKPASILAFVNRIVPRRFIHLLIVLAILLTLAGVYTLSSQVRSSLASFRLSRSAAAILTGRNARVDAPAAAAATAMAPMQSCTLGCSATVPANGTAGQAVAFQATGTPSGCATGPTFQWSFGNGDTSTQQNPSYTYNSPGNFNWQVTVSASQSGGGGSNISTVAGGEGEGSQANQASFYRLNAIVRDPLGRGIYLGAANFRTNVIYFLNTTNAPVTLGGKTFAAGEVRVVAGNGILPGGENVPGVDTSVSTIYGLATSTDGSLVFFVEESVVRALNVGTLTVTIGGGSLGPGNIRTVASSGFGTDLGGIAVNPNDNAIFVVDGTSGINRVFRVDPATGATTTIVGNGAATAEGDPFIAGAASSIPLRQPRAIEFQDGNNLIVSDTGHERVIKVSPPTAGGSATLLAQYATGSGRPFPNGVTIAGGNIYVANGNTQTVVQVTGGSGIIAGQSGIACDYQGNPPCGDGGQPANATFAFASSVSSPPLQGIEGDANGMFLLDQSPFSRARVRYINRSGGTVTLAGVAVAAGTIQTIAGNGNDWPFDGGPAGSAFLSGPIGVAADASNNLWITDTLNNRLRYTNRGGSQVTLFPGTASQQVVAPGAIVSINFDAGGIGDVIPASQANFSDPQGVFIGSQGVYIADSKGGATIPPGFSGLRTGVLRYLNPGPNPVTIYPGSASPIVVPAGSITRIAGCESSVGCVDLGFARNTKIVGLSDVVVAANGDIYVTAVGDNTVRKINASTGNVTNVTVPFSRITGIGLGPTGRLYIVDSTSGKLLRETAVGSGAFTDLATGLSSPRDVAIASNSTAYVTLASSHRIVQVSDTGVVSALAGTSQGFSGDGGPAANARLNISPPTLEVGVGGPVSLPETVGIVVAPSGDIFFADPNNNRIRRIGGASGLVTCVRSGQINIGASSNPVPSVSSLSPNTTLAGGSGFQIQVNGANFVNGSVVRWNGSDRGTTFNSSGVLFAQVLGSDIAAAGASTVTVFNPAPGGGLSPTGQTFTTTNPLPTLTGLNPSSAIAGGVAFMMTVNGTGFVTTSQVFWNGSLRTTQFNNGSSVTASISMADIANQGSASVTVVNPGPGGGTSNPLSFTIATAGQGFEADVAPRPTGNGTVSLVDYVQVGRFAAGLDTVNIGTEFQKADCAPKETLGNGGVSLADWVQAGRYAAGLDVPVPVAGGPTGPPPFAPPGEGLAVAGLASGPEQLRIVRVVNTSLVRGTQGTVNVEIVSQGDENTVGFSLGFDTTQLGFVGVALAPGLPVGSSILMNTSQTGTGRLGVAVALPIGAMLTAGTRQLIVVTFAAQLGGVGSSTPITFENSPILREVVSATAVDLTGNTTFTAGTITLTNPVPAITSLNPNSAIAGSGAFTLTVNGTNIVPGAVVSFGGNNRTTMFVGPTQVTAAILASDVQNVGTPAVTLTNPAPGGGTSPPATFTITATNPVPAITSLNPNTVVAGSGAFTLTVNGTNIVPGAVVNFGGNNRTTMVLSANQVTAAILASDVQNAGTPAVTLTNPAPGGGTSPGVTFTITAAGNPVPTIGSLSPPSATAGGPQFLLTVNGTNFIATSVVRWNGANRTTNFVSAIQLTATINAADIAGVTTASVTVFNPAPAGGTSNALNYSVTATPTSVVRVVGNSVQRGQNVVIAVELVSTGLENAVSFTFAFEIAQLGFVSAAAGSGTGGASVNINTGSAAGGVIGVTIAQNPGQTFAAGTRQLMTVTLNALPAGMAATSQINFTGSPVAMEVVGAGANLLPSSFTPGTVTFTTGPNPLPTVTSIVPNSALAGSAAFTLVVNGTGFVGGSQVQWNGAARTTTFMSATVLNAAIPASDLVNQGTAQVGVFNPAPGGGTSNTVSFAITVQTNPAPTLSSLSPNSTIAGGAQFTLFVNGANLISGAVVLWNGNNRPTTFVNSGQVSALIPVTDIAAAGTANVAVTNPAPGGGTSNTLVFTVNNPLPTATTLNPPTAVAGSGAFQLTVNGTNFNMSSVVRWNGANRATSFVSPNMLTAAIGEGDVLAQGSATVGVVNPAPGGGTSNLLTFVIGSSTSLPVINSLNPAGALAGGAQFGLTVIGANFNSASKVQWNGSNRTTTFDNSGQLTAIILASDIAQGGTATITVLNPGVNGGTSNAVLFNVSGPNPVPNLVSLNPSSIAAGSPGFILTITGSGFVNGAIVRWNGSDRATTFGSPTSVSAQISTGDVAAIGTASVTVANPAPGGGVSNALTFTITPGNPVPALTSLNPNQTASGGAAFILTVNGGNFVQGAAVNWNGSPRVTSFGSDTLVTAQITAADVATGGVASVTVVNPAPGGGLSNALNFTIVGPNPVPALTSLDPAAALVGGPAFVLTINGNNFVNGSSVLWNGSPRTTGFVNNTRLTAQISAADIAAIATVSITVVNVAPGGGTSNALSFVVGSPNPAPTLVQLSPASVAALSGQFTMTVTGTNFVANSVVQWNGGGRATTFVNATTLTAVIPASDIIFPGTASVTVFNPLPAGGTSAALSFTITNPVPSITSLTPNSTLFGGQGFTLQVLGVNFIASSVVRWNNSDRPTTFVNGTQLSASISTADIAAIATASLTVFNPAPGGGQSNSVSFFVVGPSPAPTLSLLTPNFTNVGGPAFDVIATGLNFAPTSTVQWNGANRETTFISATMLRFRVLASDIIFTGSATIRVFTPAPGGGLSLALRFTIARPLAQTNGASFVEGMITPNSIVAAFGEGLATGTGSGGTIPLPTSILGTTVSVKDQAGVERIGGLFAVSGGQVNYAMPAGTSFGVATVSILSGDGVLSIGQVQVVAVAPGIFSANSNGLGVAAAKLLRVRANGTTSTEDVARFDVPTNQWVPIPIVFGPATEQLFLIFFGTGFRARSALSAVNAQLGGTTIPVLFAGAAPGFVALDQANLGQIPRSFIGRGVVNLVFTVDLKVSNTVQVTFQ